MHCLASFIALAAGARALALPQSPTTGPSGGFSPYAQNTTITYYTGLATAPGTSIGSVNKFTTTSPLEGCGFPIGHGIIKSLYCTVLKHSEIAIGQTNNGSCTFTLYSDTDSCSVLGSGESGESRFGYNRHDIEIPNGDELTCIGTGVYDGGKFTKASGVWACG